MTILAPSAWHLMLRSIESAKKIPACFKLPPPPPSLLPQPPLPAPPATCPTPISTNERPALNTTDRVSAAPATQGWLLVQEETLKAIQKRHLHSKSSSASPTTLTAPAPISSHQKALSHFHLNLSESSTVLQGKQYYVDINS